MTQHEKYLQFKNLHDDPKCFVMPNPWDPGSARILTELGFKALATTSAGYAFSRGLKDGVAGITRRAILENAREIVNATSLPVSADLEDGFGSTPEDCALTIKGAIDVGLVGGSIEDSTGRKDFPIYDFELAKERIAAAVEARKDQPFLLTARSENFLHGRSDLDDTIKRLLAFEKAGADVLYAPGLPDLEAIKLVCQEVSKPVNVVMGLSGPTFTIAELQEAGVSRISVGGSFARAALGGLIKAATEVLEEGSFTYAKEALSNTDAQRYMARSSRDS